MALYDGFFDAVLDEAGQYDRAYDSGDFTGYFEQIIGSGVCVYENPDSFLVRLVDGAAEVSPGYLFIKGYWLKNTEYYALELPEEAGTYAVLARLNLGARMIELAVEPEAASYVDALVLAIVDTSAGTVLDTRYDTDICGAIDAVGSLSGKVEWAVDYINNEIKGKLDGIKDDVSKQIAVLDSKIDEAQNLADSLKPAAIGTIKFSASQDVGPEWLHCDGSFVSQDDYPELVAALGKITPGVEDFTEILEANTASQVSNFCFAENGTVWIYLLKPKKLIGLSPDGRKEITVSGVDDLVQLAAVDTVLSVCGGALYLAQNNQTSSTFVLLECYPFTGDENSITMTALNIAAQTSGLDMTGFVPRITEIGGKLHMALGMGAATGGTTTGTTKYRPLTTLEWTPGSFSPTKKSYKWVLTDYSSSTSGISASNNDQLKVVKSLMAFQPKNDNDLLFGQGFTYYVVSAHQIYVGFHICSVTQEIFGAPTAVEFLGTTFSPIYDGNYSSGALLNADPYYQEISASSATALNILPVAAANEYIYRAEIVNRNLKIIYGTYNPTTVYQYKTIDLRLPSLARLFKDSVVYASSQGIWFVFVGTGLMFTTSLVDGEWGYLDTQGTLGIITRYGCLDYDVESNTLYISGTNTAGIPKVGQLRLPDVYNYANDGAWLPMIASDGVPAYIKAKETEDEPSGPVTPGTKTLVVTVLSPSAIQAGTNKDLSTYASVTMNGSILGVGTYSREIATDVSTFTVGLKLLKNATNYSENVDLYVNKNVFVSIPIKSNVGSEQSVMLNVSDYIKSGVTLQWKLGN